ncbi:MAG: hypothetical protein OM95_15815 [Bdellovibrio sp. ArHS]|uniref:glycosyltransferase n=1 Tax=Bdellovibrio sp. ArHS TaxID=1569284 RepID=UPI000583FDEF|nr:glycosyltransferase [Bdellovibrio sp. ArHS]KHD87161.1 MAG: hypothetical protein OM95_15815 [Bdellovibrio sp. ArHS]
MTFWDLIVSFVGLGVLIYHTWSRRHAATKSKVGALPLVSIIVPCRNEESHIPDLIQSLKKLRDVNAEIIVVDDQSVDRTYELAVKENIKVIKAPEKPQGWVGKSWACAVGAKAARGEFFLFTDADTRHMPASLASALDFMREKNADLLSAPPYHLCLNWWEKSLGLFHLLPLVAAGFPGSRNKHRVYAIGQYLLISRQAYVAVGGHEELRSSLTEDIELAQKIIDKNLCYTIFPSATLYQVQMYDSVKEFWQGWKRLLRLGMKKVTFWAFIEVTLMFALFFQWNWSVLVALPTLMLMQRKHGAFAWWGAFLAPLSLLLFALLSAAGVIENLRKKKVTWQGREYVEI